jgi:hypothetical protein
MRRLSVLGGNSLWHTVMGTLPTAEVMGVVAVLALLVNGGVAFLLYATGAAALGLDLLAP